MSPISHDNKQNADISKAIHQAQQHSISSPSAAIDNIANNVNLHMQQQQQQVANSTPTSQSTHIFSNTPIGSGNNTTVSDHNLITTSSQTHLVGDTYNTNNNSWLELPKMNNFVDAFSVCCSTAVIFGGLIPYLPQYLKIKQSMNSDGFSTYGKWRRDFKL